MASSRAPAKKPTSAKRPPGKKPAPAKPDSARATAKSHPRTASPPPRAAKSAAKASASRGSSRAAPVTSSPERDESALPDSAAALSALYLAASHGHLTRPVDDAWVQAIDDYLQLFAKQLNEEQRRPLEARLVFMQTQSPKLRLLITSLSARARGLLQSGHRAEVAQLLPALTLANKLLGQMTSTGSLFKGAKLADAALASAVTLASAYFVSVAQVAELQRTVVGSNSAPPGR